MHIHAPPGAEIRRARSLPAKLRPPRARLRTVSRHALVEDLRRAVSPLVVLCAPAGAGKTTLLRQWDYADERPFVWVRLDDADNDPVVLLSFLAWSLGGVTVIDSTVFESLTLAEPPLRERVLPCLPRRSRPPLRSCSRSTMPTSSRETGRGASSRPCSAASRRGRSSRSVRGAIRTCRWRGCECREKSSRCVRPTSRSTAPRSENCCACTAASRMTRRSTGCWSLPRAGRQGSSSRAEQARAGRRPSGCASSPAGHARSPPTWLPKSSPRSPESSRSSCCALPSSPS